MVEVSTSILSVKDIKTIYNLEVAGTDYFHIDVMDGKFVENNTLDKMLTFVKEIKQVSNLPLDVHLMVENVENFVDEFEPVKPNIITFHYEANTNKDIVMDRINKIKEIGVRVGISIKPNTPIESIIEFLPYTHLVLVMTVEPGQGGQNLIPDTVDKVRVLKEYVDKEKIDIDIEVDGGINAENVEALKKNGANIIVAGTAILSATDYKSVIRLLKE